MKKIFGIIFIIIILVSGFFIYKFYKNRRLTESKVEKISITLIKNNKAENKIKGTLFLNDIYDTFESLTLKKREEIKQYSINLSTISVIKGRLEKRSGYIQLVGKEIIIGIWGIGKLIKENSLSCLEMGVFSNCDIQIDCFVVREKKKLIPILKEFAREVLADRYGGFSFHVNLFANSKFNNISIDFLQRYVQERQNIVGIVIKILNRDKRVINLKLRDIHLKSKYLKKIERFPSVDYFKYNKQWIKSIFIPLGSKLSYVLESDETTFFDGYLGALSGQAVEYKIKVNSKLLQKIKIVDGLKYFKHKIIPHKNKIKLEIEINGSGETIGILGNFNFYKRTTKCKNIILYLIDALRSDFGGIDRALFEKYFENGAIFKNVYANATKTADSIPSIFSGKYKFMLVNYQKDSPFLSESEFLLTEYLKTKGYTTVAFIANPWLIQNNAHQGFDFVYFSWNDTGKGYSIFPTREQYRKSKYGKMENLINEFLKLNKNKPLFIYLHTVEPHIPYELPMEMRKYSRKWDENILNSVYKFKHVLNNPSDKQIMVLKSLYKDSVICAYKFFRKICLLFTLTNVLNENTFFILTSDHGERFFEHGTWTHGMPDVYNEVLRIPLIINGEGFKPGIYSENIQLADIFPTIIDWLGDKVNKSLVGNSLLTYINGNSEGVKNRAIYSDGAARIFQYSFIKNNIKIIINKKKTELYDLIKDPEEKINLFKEKIFVELIKEARNFRNYFKLNLNKRHKVMSKEEKDRLRSLGYINE